MTALLSFAAALLGYFLCVQTFPRLGLLDFPERYGLQRRRLPYPAGVVPLIVFLGWYGFFGAETGMREIGVIIAVLFLGIVSFVDDRTHLPSFLRLGVQIAIAIIVFVAGSRIYTLTSPLGGIIKLDMTDVMIGGLTLPLWSGVFTVAWLLFTTNALNWFDGIQGQVNVISFLGFLMLGLLALFRNGETGTADIAFVLAAVALAGCFFDFPPAKVLMGDSGSMFFGFMLGLLGIYSGGKVATVFLALGLPLLDALFVILRRLRRGQSPFRGGKDHLHHLLMKKGWSEKKIIALTVCIGTVFGVSALFLSTPEKGIAILVLIALVGGLQYYATTD